MMMKKLLAEFGVSAVLTSTEDCAYSMDNRVGSRNSCRRLMFIAPFAPHHHTSCSCFSYATHKRVRHQEASIKGIRSRFFFFCPTLRFRPPRLF
ncbi:hypothetical protein DL96DRAFT_557051 [Flagelloscypha sp. PMI_526]|nr:hypothetical protein DL96DRAFT_557051 [Flagelloscypha sp. PMI_526]